MTLPKRTRRWKLGDPLSEATRTAIYGVGVVFLIAGVIVGIIAIIGIVSLGPASITGWLWLSPILFVIGFIMKMTGTKISS